MLVLTPPPHPTETLSGYLHSLAAANGYPTPNYITSHLTRRWTLANYRYVTPRELVDITGINISNAERVCLLPTNGMHKAYVNILGTNLRVREAKTADFRICPLCVADTGRHEALWHLLVVNWCPLHRIPLLTHCEQCKRPLRWGRPRVGQCHCLADLTVQGSRKECSVNLAKLLSAMRFSLYQDALIQRPPPEFQHLLHLDLYAISRLMLVLSELMHEHQASTREDEVKEKIEPDLKQYIERVADALVNWPHNFHLFLEKHYAENLAHDSKVSSVGYNRNFRQVFHWAFLRLSKHMKSRKEQFTFLTDEVYRFGAKYWNRDRLLRGERKHVTLPLLGRWGSLTEAAELLNIDVRTLQQWIETDEVPIQRAAFKKANRNFMVDLDWVRQLKTSACAPLTAMMAAKELGVSARVLIALRVRGVYRVHYRTARFRNYSVEDIEKLKSRFALAIRKRSSDGTLKNLMCQGTFIFKIKSIDKQARMLEMIMGYEIPYIRSARL